MKRRLALITRPREDSAELARDLEARGLAVMIEPLLDIVPVADAAVDPEGAQGILATSANGIRALARLLPDRTLPVWAVGDASARVARQLGFQTVASAGGDVDSLAALVAASADPAQGTLLHAAGTVSAGDLSGRLEATGFAVRRLVLYEARTATAISPTLAEALARGAVDMALFFSPRTAATFATLIAASGAGLRSATAYALSANVARALSPLPWRRIRTAADPTQAALLAALDDDLAREPPR